MELRALLRGKQLDETQEPGWLQFEDTDHAVEWCEDQLLGEADAAPAAVDGVTDIGQQYLCAGMTGEELEALRQAGEERRFAAGTLIVNAGDAADSLYFILSGEVEVSIDTDSGQRLRLTTLGPGMGFGEVALLNQQRRTANVMATVDTLCLENGFDALKNPMKTKMLVNMASDFARKIERETELVQHLG